MLVCLYRMESGQRSGQKESWGFTTRSGQATRQIHLGEKAPTNDIHCPPLYAWLLRGTWHVTVSAVRQRVWWILHLEAGGCLCQRKRSHHSWAPVPFWWSHSSDSWSEAETSNERLGEVHVRKMMTVDNASQQLFLNFNKQSWVFPALSIHSGLLKAIWCQHCCQSPPGTPTLRHTVHSWCFAPHDYRNLICLLS